MEQNTVFIRNIPFEFTEDEFKNKIKKFAPFMFVRYVKKNN